MRSYRILSLDGGGIRGVITTVMMQRLNKEPALAGWLDSVDLIAGTSTGGLLALGLAKGLGLEEIRSLYVEKGAKIFDDSWLDNVLDLGTIIGAQYSNGNLSKELQRLLGQTTLSQLQKHVLITSFDLDNEDKNPSKRKWKPKLFHNFPGPNTDKDQLAYKVGLYTSAAPTYFPSVDGYIDGGVYANNPSMCAVAQALDPRYKLGVNLSDLVLLSLGTGTSLVHIERKTLNWGLAQWAKPLIDLIMDGVSGIADYQCEQILAEKYQRLAPVFPAGVSLPLDAVKRVPEMVAFAENVPLADTVAWLKKFWMPAK